MNLFNNANGRSIGANSNFMLLQKVKWSIDRGDGKYLNNLDIDRRATIQTQLIPTEK